MGYDAVAQLVYGFPLTKQEAERISEEEKELYNPNKKGDVGLVYSGHGAGQMHSPVLGILLGEGFEWEPKTTSIHFSDRDLELLKDACEELAIPYRKPDFMLVAAIW